MSAVETADEALKVDNSEGKTLTHLDANEDLESWGANCPGSSRQVRIKNTPFKKNATHTTVLSADNDFLSRTVLAQGSIGG